MDTLKSDFQKKGHINVNYTFTVKFLVQKLSIGLNIWIIYKFLTFYEHFKSEFMYLH